MYPRRSLNATALSASILTLVACQNDAPASPSLRLPPLVVERSAPAVDIEGHQYRTLKIGTQTWMVENLKTVRLNDGERVPYTPAASDWAHLARLALPGYCWFGNDVSRSDLLGALYNWHTVSTGKLAPAGWHVPSEDEWQILISHVGGVSVAGRRLHEIGFRAQGAGLRTDEGEFSAPDLDKYWTTTVEGCPPTDARYCTLTLVSPTVALSSHPRGTGHSVRCVKDP